MKRIPRTFPALWVAPMILLGACGGEPEIVEFRAEPQAIERSGQGVELHWRVLNAESVCLEPCSEEVESTGSTSITIRDETVITLRASNGVGTVSRSLTIEAIKVRLDGHVQDLSGIPVGEAVVRFAPAFAPVEVSEQGSFSAEVLPPYSVRAETSNQVVYYAGLFRPDPVMTLERSISASTTRITGRLTGFASATETNVVFQGTTDLSYGVLNSDGTYEINAKTRGPELVGRVVGLEMNPQTGSSTAFGASEALVCDAGEHCTVDVALVPVDSIPTSLEVQGGPATIVTLVVTSSGLIDLPLSTWPGTVTEISVPDMAGGESLVLVVYASNAEPAGNFSARMDVQAGVPLHVTIGAAPELIEPLDGAVASGSVVLRWTSDLSLCRINFAVPGKTVTAITESRELRLRDLGIRARSGERAIWSVDCFSSPTEVDAFATSQGYGLRSAAEKLASSETWDFTFQ